MEALVKAYLFDRACDLIAAKIGQEATVNRLQGELVSKDMRIAELEKAATPTTEAEPPKAGA